MSVVLALLIAVPVLAAAAFGFGAVLVARNAKRKLAVVEGARSAAPATWVGSHDEEATLHRRVQAAVAAMHTALGPDSKGRPGVAEVEAEAIRLDGELVRSAALERSTKGPVLEQLRLAVVELEAVCSQVSGSDVGDDGVGVRGALGGLAEHLNLVRQAMHELDAIERPASRPLED